jgi:hypothetical protein
MSNADPGIVWSDAFTKGLKIGIKRGRYKIQDSGSDTKYEFLENLICVIIVEKHDTIYRNMWP